MADNVLNTVRIALIEKYRIKKNLSLEHMLNIQCLLLVNPTKPRFHSPRNETTISRQFHKFPLSRFQGKEKEEKERKCHGLISSRKSEKREIIRRGNLHGARSERDETVVGFKRRQNNDRVSRRTEAT